MIAGGYSLDLYCDNMDAENRRLIKNEKGQLIDNFGHRWQEFPHQYIDELGSRCRSDARRDGWIINEKANKALCPKCNPKSPHYQKPD